MIKLGLYTHYKGNKYEVIGACRHSETLEEMLIYRALYGDYRLWVRPYDLFTGMIEHEGKKVPRFQYNSATISDFPKLR